VGRDVPEEAREGMDPPTFPPTLFDDVSTPPPTGTVGAAHTAEPPLWPPAATAKAVPVTTL
jgi:hypothetical protein